MEEIYQEGRFFLASLLSGIVILFLYDFLRIFRCVLPHKKWAVFWEDYFFWVLSGFFVFLMIYQVNKGSIRSFAIIGIGLGMCGYHLGPSTAWVCLVSRIIKFVLRILNKIYSFIEKPFVFLSKKWNKWRKMEMEKISKILEKKREKSYTDKNKTHKGKNEKKAKGRALKRRGKKLESKRQMQKGG